MASSSLLIREVLGLGSVVPRPVMTSTPAGKCEPSCRFDAPRPSNTDRYGPTGREPPVSGTGVVTLTIVTTAGRRNGKITMPLVRKFSRPSSTTGRFVVVLVTHRGACTCTPSSPAAVERGGLARW